MARWLCGRDGTSWDSVHGIPRVSQYLSSNGFGQLLKRFTLKLNAQIETGSNPEQENTTEREIMKAEMGLWIDHREAVIVVLSKTGQEIKRIASTAEKQLHRSGEPSNGSFEAQDVPADDSLEREYTGHLAHYYDEVISYLRAAGSILIFGPGEAKGELKKRAEKDKRDARIMAVETSDKMTDPQIMAKVRNYFHYAAATGGAERRRGK
jgi:hypothetical protein